MRKSQSTTVQDQLGLHSLTTPWTALSNLATIIINNDFSEIFRVYEKIQLANY
ncbi:hypothetical protein CROQUDRAFT_93154 [Cronartium quercuum f. sp. fusiforme G11]|uniref:Uncharacterized protein n=1 Tax=Cronartium quercuum f. sp. fusiforme G11 TaxID=708437 RepID=A0A9P6TBS2_9BASI|nr:hypothetical protein CROQUDRAFT_93154 [Cronartium quercuum f. sp. fusiforme G11]